MILLVRLPIILYLDILEIYDGICLQLHCHHQNRLSHLQLFICCDMSNTSLPELYKRCLEKTSKLCDLPTIDEETQVKKQLFSSHTSTCLELQLTP